MKQLSSKPVVLWIAAIAFQLAGCAQVSDFVADKRPAEDWAAAQMNIGRLHEKQGRLDKARDIYLEIHDEAEGDELAAVSHRLGIVCGQLGEIDEAKAYFQEALAGSTRKSLVLNDLGYLLYMRDDLDEAQRILELAAAENPNDERIVNNLALVLGKQGNIEESFSLFRRNVGEAEANANIAFLHTVRGEGAKATDRYSRALTLDDQLTSAANALAQIADMKQRLNVAKKLNATKLPSDTVLASSEKSDVDVGDQFKNGSLEPVDSVVQTAAVSEETTTAVVTADAVAVDGQSAQSEGVQQATIQPAGHEAPETSVPDDSQAIIDAIRQMQDHPVDPDVTSRELTELLSHWDPSVRVFAARGLLTVSRNTGQALSVLVAGMSDSQPKVRAIAVNFVQDLENKPPAVIEALRTALYDTDVFVRLYAANAIGTSDVTVSVVTACLSHQDARARWLASLALADMAPQREDTVAALRVALTDQDPRTRAGAAAALGNIGPYAESALLQLEAAQADADQAVQEAAETAVVKIRSN